MTWKERGIHIHLSQSDANTLHGSIAAAIVALGGPAVAVSGPIAAAVAGVIAAARVFAQDGKGNLDIRISEHALQVGNLNAVDPNVLYLGLWAPAVTGLKAIFGITDARDTANPIERAETAELKLEAPFPTHGALLGATAAGGELVDAEPFYDRFAYCMSLNGMPVPPADIFGSYTLVVAQMSLLVSLVEKFGKSVTLAELVGAGYLAEWCLVAAGIGAAYWFGVAVGCLGRAGFDVSGLPTNPAEA